MVSNLVDNKRVLQGESGDAVINTVYSGLLNRADIIRDGISGALRAAVAAAVASSVAGQNVDTTIYIPAGDFVHDGEYITIPPWIKFYLFGKTRITSEAGSGQFLWIRGDLAGYSPQSLDDAGSTTGDFSADASNINEIFTGPGQIQVKNMTLANGSNALRVGSGDGVWGDLYSGSRTVYVTKSRIGRMHIRGFDQALQFTNGQSFSLEFDTLNINGSRYETQHSYWNGFTVRSR